ncbi:hypothetical protein D9758_010121 [Tetrapyrgos nigripes]|uniref:RING-type domain-containing protein n=1 Tax=Tetrapyrgos nigripes TaxID=182062 RepID=A0A8H5CST7_9AGAR|nr:hypothetical protein D9758_010121 [Tetrapyrgos nigripes]
MRMPLDRPVKLLYLRHCCSLLEPLISVLDTPIHDMDQNTSTIAELRAEQVDQISDNVSRVSYRLASLSVSADADSSSSSPLPHRLQWAVERAEELFNELEPQWQRVIVLPRIRKLIDLGPANQTNVLGLGLQEFDKFGQLLGRLVTAKERRSKIPLVRYLPWISDIAPSKVNGPASPEWLAMFVHSDVPSVCIEDHNACCNICLEDFEEPPLLELQVDGGDDADLMAEDDAIQASPKPLRQLKCGHVLHEECLPMFRSYAYNSTFKCPACRTKVWTPLKAAPEQFSFLSPKIPRDAARNNVSSDQLQTYDDYWNSLPPWQKMHEELFNWATQLHISKLDEALNSTIHGRPVNKYALAIWAHQMYKRYLYSRMTGSPEGLVDCLPIDSMDAWTIHDLVSKGKHGDASRELRMFWDNWGLQDAPRLLMVLAEHVHPNKSHWVVHRFSLPDGALTTYHFHSELHACPDCRPASWWLAICLAWPDAAICANPGMPTRIHLHQPMELGVDDSVAAIGIQDNILMGLPVEHSVDIENLRGLMHTEVKNLCERYISWTNYLSAFFGDLHDRCERVEGDRPEDTRVLKMTGITAVMVLVYFVLLLGDSGVGKSKCTSTPPYPNCHPNTYSSTHQTPVVIRYQKNEFNPQSRNTIGVDFSSGSVKIDGKIVGAHFWDTSGQERFKSITSSFYRGAYGAFLVYDITRRDTFENISTKGGWLDELRQSTNENGVVTMLVGNKSDLAGEGESLGGEGGEREEVRRQVSTEEAKAFADANGLLFMETSAKDASNVEQAFEGILTEIYHTVSSTSASSASHFDQNGSESISPSRSKAVDISSTPTVKLDQGGGCAC